MSDQCHFHHSGDGTGSWWQHDAMGITLARVCDDCIKEKLSRYDPAVLTDSCYELLYGKNNTTQAKYTDVVEEQIEPDE